MGIRTALSHSRVFTVVALLFGAWLVVTALDVWTAIDWATFTTVGRGTTAGIAGLLVMVGMFVLVATLFGELGESEPEPELWPPE